MPLSLLIWMAENPIGKVATGIGNSDTTVIGIVANIHESSIETAPNPEVYVPVTQNGDISGSELVVRSGLPIESLGLVSCARCVR